MTDLNRRAAFTWSTIIGATLAILILALMGMIIWGQFDPVRTNIEECRGTCRPAGDGCNPGEVYQTRDGCLEPGAEQMNQEQVCCIGPDAIREDDESDSDDEPPEDNPDENPGEENPEEDPENGSQEPGGNEELFQFKNPEIINITDDETGDRLEGGSTLQVERLNTKVLRIGTVDDFIETSTCISRLVTRDNETYAQGTVSLDTEEKYIGNCHTTNGTVDFTYPSVEDIDETELFFGVRLVENTNYSNEYAETHILIEPRS